MLTAIRPLSALLIGVLLLMVGSGLLASLLAIRGQQEGFSAQTLGLITSAYFGGFLLGTYVAPGLIRRMGHIRAFAFYAQLCAAVVLLHPVLRDAWAWGALRLLTGLSLVGLCTVIESWLNAQAPADRRSQVFAVYMAVNLGGLGVGQLVFGVSDPASFVPFSVAAIVICMAALPVTASRMVQPDIPDAPQLGVGALFRAAPAAASGALLAGMALGAFWGLTAVYASRLGLGVSAVAAVMLAAIAGGAALQLPIGRLSDRGDRRSTLAALSIVAALLAAVMTAMPGEWTQSATPWRLYALAFGFGAAVFAVYPVCVAHLMDHLPAPSMLPGVSSLLLVNGVGAAVGPAIAGVLMARLGPQALPGFFAATFALLALIAGARRIWRQRERDHPAHFHPMIRTTPSALELLPETQPTTQESATPS